MLAIDPHTNRIFEISEEEFEKKVKELNDQLLRDGFMYSDDVSFIPIYTELKSDDVTGLQEVFYKLEFEDFNWEF